MLSVVSAFTAETSKTRHSARRVLDSFICLEKLGVGDEALYILVSFVANGFHTHDVPGFAGTLADESFRSSHALLIVLSSKQLARNKHTITAVQRCHQDHARGTRLVMKPLSRNRKNEKEN